MSVEFASPEAVAEVGLEHRFSRTDGKQLPTVIFVHGRAGDSGVMFAFRRQFPEQANVLSFQAPHSDPIGGYSWWDASLSREETIREAARSAELLEEAIEKALSFYSFSKERLWIAGFSQGGAMISLLLQRREHAFERAGLLSTFLVENNREFIGNYPRASVFLYHGEEDAIVPVRAAWNTRTQLESQGFDLHYFEEPGVKHKVGKLGMRALKDFFAE